MTPARIIVVALVNRNGAVLLRTREDLSALRPNRWSLPGDAAATGEDPEAAARRIVKAQTGLDIAAPLRLVWHGRTPQPPAEVFFFASSCTATNADLPSDSMPGAIPRYHGNVLYFLPGPDVLSGRSFTPITGFVLGRFLASALYRELAA